MREFHTIVEYSYNQTKQVFIVRFLDGTCLKVPVEHLPQKYQQKTAKWDAAELNKEKSGLTVKTGSKKMEVPAHVLYSSGRIM